MDQEYYLEFENEFRGKREEIISRQKNYDGVIRYLLKNHKKPNILDIGCGRGEWIQKCQEKGLIASGIELNTQMISLCRKYNLDILEGDALSILKQIESQSFNLITSFHLIEHLDNKTIGNIICECKRILKDDGLLIFETPSIDNLVISTRQFYLDPTHINPINPEGITFLIKKCGFDQAKYFFINGGQFENANQLSLTRVLNGVGQDLAIFATSTLDGTKKFFTTDQDWKEELNLASGTIQTSIQFDEKVQNMDRQIQELIMRQDKIFNSWPVKVFKFIKEKIITTKLNLSKLKYKLVFKISLIAKKIFKKLLNDTKKLIIIIIRLITYILAKLKLSRLERHLIKIISRIDSKLILKVTDSLVWSPSIDQNKRLINHFFSSKSAQKIHNDFIRFKHSK